MTVLPFDGDFGSGLIKGYNDFVFWIGLDGIGMFCWWVYYDSCLCRGETWFGVLLHVMIRGIGMESPSWGALPITIAFNHHVENC